MRRAFLFDIGNVILRFDFGPGAARLAAQSETDAAGVLERLSGFKNELESGRIGDEEFIARGAEAIGFRGTRDGFAQAWSDIFELNDPMVAVIERLAAEHPLYLFSNTNGLHHRWFTARFGVFRHFRGGILSHEVGCMKPDEPFYRAAIGQFGLDPAATFYIDDLAENIATGRRLGFATHQYHPDRHPALEQDLGRWLAGD